MKLIAFDIETANTDPNALKEGQQLGISCAALLVEGQDEPMFWHGPPGLPCGRRQLVNLVETMLSFVDDGYQIVTINGCGFDFRVLAEESGLVAECRWLAERHVDLMLIPLRRRGWPVGLEAFAVGSGVEGKLKTVRLKNGDVISDMTGAKAPQLWADGEQSAVLAYLADDVRVTLDVARVARDSYVLRWVSRKGAPYMERVPVPLPSAAEVLRWKQVDQSWLDNPMNADALMDWGRRDVAAG